MSDDIPKRHQCSNRSTAGAANRCAVTSTLAARGESRAWHRDRADTCLARRDEEEYWPYSPPLEEVSASPLARWMPGRMPRTFTTGC